MPKLVDRSLDEIATLLGASLEAERSASAPGFLQRRDPRAKIITALILLLAAGLIHRPMVLLALYLCALVAAVVSRLPVMPMLRREWVAAAFFAGVVALPAIFTTFTPGPALWRVPGGPGISRPGVEAALRLLLRAVTSIHIVLTLVGSTPWHRVLRGLRGIGVPPMGVLILAMAHRYIFLLITIMREMLMGREARRVGNLSPQEMRKQMTASAGALFLRSQDMGQSVFAAMAARGFRGEPKDLAPARWTIRDTLLSGGALLLSILLVYWDRHAA